MAEAAGYVAIAGHQTWMVEGGDKPASPLLLLHGGLSDHRDLLAPLGPALGAQHRLLAFDRIGHGRTADSGEPFSYPRMTGETIAAIGHFGAGPVDLVGWSDGGNIGLLLALARPDLVRRMVLIGANYHYSGVTPAPAEMDRNSFKRSEAAFAASSPNGAAAFASVLDRVLHMWSTEPVLTAAELGAIATPTLVMAGDRDMITLQHTTSMFEALPVAQLAIVPGTSHFLAAEKPDLVARLILDFLAG